MLLKLLKLDGLQFPHLNDTEIAMHLVRGVKWD